MGFLRFKASRRLKAFDAGLADAIDMMARALRAGHSMSASINVVAEQSLEPVRSEFSEVFKQQNFGLPLRDAMQQMMDRVPSQDLRVLVTGILVQKETGGNLAEILDRTAQTIRKRQHLEGLPGADGSFSADATATLYKSSGITTLSRDPLHLPPPWRAPQAAKPAYRPLRRFLTQG